MLEIDAYITPGELSLRFPYDPKLVEWMHTIPGPKFDPRRKSWSVSKQYRERLTELAALIRKVDAAHWAIADGFIAKMRRAMPELQISKHHGKRTLSLRAGRVGLDNIRNTGLTRWDKIAKCFDVEPRDEAAFQRLLFAVFADAEFAKGLSR